MAHEPIVHLAASQTTPDIYADRVEFPSGFAADGYWHQWTIALTLDGSCHWHNSTGSFVVTPGHVTLTQPRAWMFWDADSQRGGAIGWECCYAIFHPRPHWHAWLESFEYCSGMAHLGVAEAARKEIARAMNDLVEAYKRGGSMRDQWALNELERVLMRLYALQPSSRVAQDTRVCEAVEFICERFPERLTLEDIAGAACLSASHLSTLFTAAMGVAPSAYLERIRLERATEMLRFGTAGIAEIARATGYGDPEYFARRFRVHYGQSPREYRYASRPRSDEKPPRAAARGVGRLGLKKAGRL